MRKVKNIIINEALLNEIIEEKRNDLAIIHNLENSSFSLSGEPEMAYFSSVRKFFRNNISHNIMNRNQELIKKI